MIVDGERLIIDFDMSLEEVVELQKFIEPRVAYIDEIVSEAKPNLGSSALLQLLLVIKKARPEISIPFIEALSYEDENLGTITWKSLWT